MDAECLASDAGITNHPVLQQDHHGGHQGQYHSHGPQVRPAILGVVLRLVHQSRALCRRGRASGRVHDDNDHSVACGRLHGVGRRGGERSDGGRSDSSIRRRRRRTLTVCLTLVATFPVDDRRGDRTGQD